MDDFEYDDFEDDWDDFEDDFDQSEDLSQDFNENDEDLDYDDFEDDFDFFDEKPLEVDSGYEITAREVHISEQLTSSRIIRLMNTYPSLKKITCPPSLYKRISPKYLAALDELNIVVLFHCFHSLLLFVVLLLCFHFRSLFPFFVLLFHSL